jgi:hydroxyacylglutathione hydrolase
MNSWRSALLAVVLLSTPLSVWSQLTSGSLDVRWNEGSEHCPADPQPLIQVHPYNSQTFILRENLCATFEAPFMYLLQGSSKALLIDTGDMADSKQMSVARTVMDLLPRVGTSKMPLIVAHTHRHLDHRAGDTQFANLPNVEVVPYDLAGMQRFFNFTDWPNDLAQVNLGDRTVDVLPTPGHNATHISFYDRNTGLFFSGDFLLPGRLLIDDAGADLASANRAVDFVKNRPVSQILGGHIELNRAGHLYPWGSQYHPDERPLQLTKADLLALPAALRGFNGFYSRRGDLILMNQMRDLIAAASMIVVVLITLGIWGFRYFRRRRASRGQ